MPYPMAAARGKGSRIAPYGIINIDHETGDTSQYTSMVSDGCTVGAGSALGGSRYGLQVVVDDTTATYGQKTQTISTGVISVRFRFHPNTLTMATNDTFWIHRTTSATTNSSIVQILKTATSLQLKCTYCNDVSSVTTVGHDISVAEHVVEYRMSRASSNVASDGTFTWWVDGVLLDTASGIDNYDSFSSMLTAQFGAVAGVDSGTSGTFYIDEIIINDTGDPIGA